MRAHPMHLAQEDQDEEHDVVLDFGECGTCKLPLPVATSTITEDGLRCADCRVAERQRRQDAAVLSTRFQEALEERTKILAQLAAVEHWLEELQQLRPPFQPSV